MQNLITFFTQSSEDPTKTSATLTGILIALSAWVQHAGIAIPFINSFYSSAPGQQVEPALTAVGMVIGGIWFLFGLFRKLTNKVERSNGLRVE